MGWRLGACACVAFAGLAAGCDGNETDGSRIEIAGASSEDRQIAADLRAYFERGCRRIPTLEQAREMIQHPDDPRGEALSPDAARRFIARRYGSIKGAIQSFRRTCGGYRRIDTEQSVITVETALNDDRLGRISAQDVCNNIQGSDVADFTPGHRILGNQGELLANCPHRD